MSITALEWAFRTEVGSPTAKLVLLKLADNANDDGECWPSFKHLERHTELSERAIRDNIKRLTKAGLVSVRHRRAEGVNLPNVYRLHMTAREVRHAAGVGQHVPGGGAAGAGGVGQQVPPNRHIEPSMNPIPAPAVADALQTEFDEFWQLYPRKEEKKGARKSFKTARKEASFDALMNGLRRYAAKHKAAGTETKFLKQPTTWLNNGCWDDEDDPGPGGSRFANYGKPSPYLINTGETR